MRALLVAFLLSSAAIQAQTPPSHLFHWTNSRRFPSYQQVLEQNRLPLRASQNRGGDGAEFFFAGHADAAQREAFFMSDDVVGGMGAGSVEFYAKLDESRGVKPRLIVVETNPRARVRTVKTILNTSNGLEGGPSTQSLAGVDLVLHEVWQRRMDGGLDLALKEWVALTDQAHTRVLSHLPDILPFVARGIERLTTRQHIDSHAPGFYDFNSNAEARTRALQALLYVQSGQVSSEASCAEALGITLRRGGLF